MKRVRVKAKEVEPLRNKRDIKRVADYIQDNYWNGDMLRLMFIIGCNTGLRASDIRQIKYSDLDSTGFIITEQKTHKQKEIIISDNLRKEINKYLSGTEREKIVRVNGKRVKAVVKEQIMNVNDDELVFSGIHQGKVIGVKYMHFLIKNACRELNIKGNFGSHTMRKTFAYHVYSRCGDLERLKGLLNHSTKKMTLLYLKDFKDEKRGKKTQITDIEVFNQNLGN